MLTPDWLQTGPHPNSCSHRIGSRLDPTLTSQPLLIGSALDPTPPKPLPITSGPDPTPKSCPPPSPPSPPAADWISPRTTVLPDWVQTGSRPTPEPLPTGLGHGSASPHGDSRLGGDRIRPSNPQPLTIGSRPDPASTQSHPCSDRSWTRPHPPPAPWPNPAPSPTGHGICSPPGRAAPDWTVPGPHPQLAPDSIPPHPGVTQNLTHTRVMSAPLPLQSPSGLAGHRIPSGHPWTSPHPRAQALLIGSTPDPKQPETGSRPGRAPLLPGSALDPTPTPGCSQLPRDRIPLCTGDALHWPNTRSHPS